MERKTCFVISPIGEEGSDVRKHADLVLKRIIQRALPETEYEYWRADHKAVTSDIIVDMMDHIHQADLCVIILTGLNPNVMYEYGIRHETGKPYILMADKAQQENPFDIHSKRTVRYDINDVDSVQNCIDELRRMSEVLLGKTDEWSKGYEFLEQFRQRLEENEVDVSMIPLLQASLPKYDFFTHVAFQLAKNGFAHVVTDLILDNITCFYEIGETDFHRFSLLNQAVNFIVQQHLIADHYDCVLKQLTWLLDSSEGNRFQVCICAWKLASNAYKQLQEERYWQDAYDWIMRAEPGGTHECSVQLAYLYHLKFQYNNDKDALPTANKMIKSYLTRNPFPDAEVLVLACRIFDASKDSQRDKMLMLLKETDEEVYNSFVSESVFQRLYQLSTGNVSE